MVILVNASNFPADGIAVSLVYDDALFGVLSSSLATDIEKTHSLLNATLAKLDNWPMKENNSDVEDRFTMSSVSIRLGYYRLIRINLYTTKRQIGNRNIKRLRAICQGVHCESPRYRDQICLALSDITPFAIRVLF